MQSNTWHFQSCVWLCIVGKYKGITYESSQRETHCWNWVSTGASVHELSLPRVMRPDGTLAIDSVTDCQVWGQNSPQFPKFKPCITSSYIPLGVRPWLAAFHVANTKVNNHDTLEHLDLVRFYETGGPLIGLCCAESLEKNYWSVAMPTPQS